MDSRLFIVAVAGGRDPEGCLEMVDGLLRFAPGARYMTKEAVTMVGLERLVNFREDIHRLGCGLFCSAEPLVFVQQPTEESAVVI